ncbi:hypothetical protein AALP_AA5G008200 [Arabis alpina]|uniref:Uncharacterized protein n=1 Tax=Arabis alpina TaxID=50452 RepID=A0A087GU51_ARAAL|nr:hypothetical protein AALP_AA5G008200 [Arabis alpina]
MLKTTTISPHMSEGFQFNQIQVVRLGRGTPHVTIQTGFELGLDLVKREMDSRISYCFKVFSRPIREFVKSLARSLLRPCKNREVTRVLVSDVSDTSNAQSPSLIDEQVVDTRNSPDVKVEQNEDEISERFDLALFLRKKKYLTHGKRRARKFRPPDPPGSTLSMERSLSLLRKKLNIPDEIELVVPEHHERSSGGVFYFVRELSRGVLPVVSRSVLTGPAPKVPSNWKTVWDLLSIRGCNWKEDFSLRRVEKARALLGGSSVSSFRFSDCSGDIQSKMERPRSFRSVVPKTTGSGKPPTQTTATTSAAPTAVPALAEPTTAPASATPTIAPASVRPTTAPAYAKLTTVPTSGRLTTVPPSEPHDTSSAKKTTTTAKGSHLPSVARTEVVTALPALPAPLPSDYDAKRAAKGKGHDLVIATLNSLRWPAGSSVPS